jgi:outer membrane protein assembly factor BamB
MIRAALLALVFASPAFAENWPSWRGPDRNGISHETMLPVQWSEKQNVAWKIPMPGKGGATPIVWGDRIFIVSGVGNTPEQVLLCLGTDGKELWRKKIGAGGRNNIRGDEANEASATPSTDGKHVYAFVGSGFLACFDFDGNEKWNIDIQKKYGKFGIQHGIHISPVLFEDRLYLSLLHANAQLVIAFDKATGDEVWKVKRASDAKGESLEAYASPFLWNDGKENLLIVLGSDYATAHRLKDGSEAWRLGDLNPKKNYSTALRIIASPVGSSDVLVVPTARGGLTVAVKPGAAGEIAHTEHEFWRKGKGAPDVPSPLVHDGIAYLCRENGILQAWDAKSGKELYQHRFHDDRYRASPVFGDGKVYIGSRNGTFVVVKAGPKFELLSTNNLDDTFTASPAISGGVMYLRGFNSLYAIREGAK